MSSAGQQIGVVHFRSGNAMPLMDDEVFYDVNNSGVPCFVVDHADPLDTITTIPYSAIEFIRIPAGSGSGLAERQTALPSSSELPEMGDDHADS